MIRGQKLWGGHTDLFPFQAQPLPFGKPIPSKTGFFDYKMINICLIG